MVDDPIIKTPYSVEAEEARNKLSEIFEKFEKKKENE